MKTRIATRNILFILFLLFSVSMNSCSGHSVKSSDKSKQAIVDTLKKVKQKPKSKFQQQKDDGVPSIPEILDNQKKSYKDTVKIDTTFLINGDIKMTISLRHYCTYNNKINLPLRYLKIYNLSKFQTHDFVSALEVKVNSKIVFKGLIKKENFRNLLDEELNKYAVLLNPSVNPSKDGLYIHYSVSVPLSDVGKGLTLTVDTLGNEHYGAD